jgi:hypothetical protein
MRARGIVERPYLMTISPPTMDVTSCRLSQVQVVYNCRFCDVATIGVLAMGQGSVAPKFAPSEEGLE